MSDVKLLVHPKAIEALDRRAEALISHIIRKPFEEGMTKPNIFVPDLDIQQTFDADEIKYLTSSIVDVEGITLSKFLNEGNEQIGLEQDQYRDLTLISEEFQRLPGVKSYLSIAAVADSILMWLIDRHRNRTQLPMSQYCLSMLEETIVQIDIWVPIFGLHCEYSFGLAKTIIHPLSRQFFDEWEQSLSTDTQINNDGMRARISNFRRQLQGGAACTIQLQAEPRRAEEIAMEETENALSLLRIYLPSNLHPSIPSYCRPFGKEDVETKLILKTGRNTPTTWSEGIDSNVHHWTLFTSEIGELERAGLGHIHELYLIENKSKFQIDLMKSLMIYSKSSLKKDTADRLIYIFTALDSFLLQNSKENIQQNLVERIVFTISRVADERKRIKKTILAAYELRSNSVHHNESLTAKDITIVSEFLEIAFRFFALMIAHHSQFETRQHFFDEVESIKYSSPLSAIKFSPI